MSDRYCKNCKWACETSDTHGRYGMVFECRGMPPVTVVVKTERTGVLLMSDSALDFEYRYPLVDGNKWCGFFKDKYLT